MNSPHSILVLRGAAVTPYLDDVAGLRIAVFADWPYLYRGDPGYERDYLAAYAVSPDSVFVLALEGSRVVGASTGLPLADDAPAFSEPFRAAGIAPQQVCDWYLAVYMDAFDWVELPNTLGMVMHADGGYLGSKPYCASGQYIKRMSDYCGDCAYKVSESTGESACPFNALYWHFLMRHRDQLRGNQRLGMVYRNLERMPEERQQALWQRGEQLLARLDAGEML